MQKTQTDIDINKLASLIAHALTMTEPLNNKNKPLVWKPEGSSNQNSYIQRAVLIREDGMRIGITANEYGNEGRLVARMADYLVNGKIRYSIHEQLNYTERTQYRGNITMSLSKTPRKLAHDIRNRLISEATEYFNRAVLRYEQEMSDWKARRKTIQRILKASHDKAHSADTLRAPYQSQREDNPHYYDTQQPCEHDLELHGTADSPIDCIQLYQDGTVRELIVRYLRADEAVAIVRAISNARTKASQKA